QDRVGGAREVGDRGHGEVGRVEDTPVVAGVAVVVGDVGLGDPAVVGPAVVNLGPDRGRPPAGAEVSRDGRGRGGVGARPAGDPQQLIHVTLLHVGEDLDGPAEVGRRAAAAGVGLVGEAVVGVVVAVHGQADLVQVVGAVGPRRRLADLLDGGQQ